MSNKPVISLATGLEDSEKLTVATLMAVGAVESGRPTRMFLTKEAVRLTLPGSPWGPRVRAVHRWPPWSSGIPGQRPLLRQPDLLRRQSAGQVSTHRWRRARRHRAAVAVDRRRSCDHLLLLMRRDPAAVRDSPGAPATGTGRSMRTDLSERWSVVL